MLGTQIIDGIDMIKISSNLWMAQHVQCEWMDWKEKLGET